MIQEKILMKQVEVKYTPGMRIIVRGEEWLVKKVETNSLGTCNRSFSACKRL